MHLDIAGPSYADAAYDYFPQGASGTEVKTLYRWVAAYNMFTIERIDIGESVKLSSIFLMGMTFPETLVIDLSKYNY
ncbi:hypothetical protein CL176_09690 [Suicoccus acidiformans]|uniref:Uncharacterized protein n=1 Tax=Suicoccus acidiformans TaxID=2036206 RepID=A0A347WMD8_9LACT|nr:hypothetical protein CL176_09690 [Suicoccus acidiformans]